MLSKLEKWRLILGKESDPANQLDLSETEQQMDDVLEALYNSDRAGGLGSSSPNVNRWLGDIKKYFPSSVVEIMQQDAIERLGIHELLTSQELLEQLEPTVHLVSTILSLQSVIPSETKSTARMVVRKVVEELQKRLRSPMEEAIKGAINKSQRHGRPRWQEIDWHRTIQANLKHYQPEVKAIIPERLIGYKRKGQALKHVILLVDQSGSMASSLVYSSVYGATMAALPSLKTHFVAFDTSLVDLTAHLDDPVDLLFGTQLGGGTDIGKAIHYAHQLIEQPLDTIVVLISDLYEGGNTQTLFQAIDQIDNSGAQLIGLLTLSDEGKPDYNQAVAKYLSEKNFPAFACTPDQFPAVMSAAIMRGDMSAFG